MKETTPAAMPPCFDKWCQRFDDLLRTKAQKKGLERHFILVFCAYTFILWHKLTIDKITTLKHKYSH